MTIAFSGPVSCSSCPIRHRAVCSKCDPDELGVLEAIKYYTEYEAGQPILMRGDPLAAVASVVKGTVSLSQSMEDGRTQMVGLVFPSDFIGRPGREFAPYDVTAVTDVTLCCFRRRPFEDLIASTPNLGNRLLEISLDELDAAREWMLVLGRKTAREKIASLFTLIAQRSLSVEPAARSGEIRINSPLTRDTMADFLGLTLETVSRQISKLRAEGVIILDGKREIIIPDLTRLMIEAGDDQDGGLPV